MYYTQLAIYLGVLHAMPWGREAVIIQNWLEHTVYPFCSSLLSPGVKVLRSVWYASGFYHNMGQYVQWVFLSTSRINYLYIAGEEIKMSYRLTLIR